MKKYKILLVDDDPLILIGVGKFLENKGYQVTTADSGEKAIKLLEEATFDLVITDLIMNHVNGIQVLKESKRLNPDAMNMILTGYGDMDTAIDALRLNADDFLLKPCEHTEINFRIANCLEKIELKRKLKNATEEIRKIQKIESLGLLAGGMAHDFNNLLSVIHGNISMSKDDVKPEYGITEFLNEAEDASLRAKELTNKLILLSKGGAPVRKAGTIEDLVKETINFTLSGSGIEVDFFLQDDLWLVNFDGNQMRHSVKSIINNAVEAMPDGGSINVKIENFVSSSETTKQSLSFSKKRYVKISIQDQGAGISEENLSLIFEPYFSTKNRGTQKGMGLGLATTYSIINKHDGHIWAESEVGVGTTISIYLPVEVEEITKIKPVKMIEPGKPAFRTGRILVMDDEEMIRNVSRHRLSRLGYEPGLAAHGEEAIAMYGKAMETGESFDAVILDLTIKDGMGGKDTIRELFQLDPNIKAIVSSGYCDDPVMSNYSAYGFKGALPKPHTKKELNDMLDQVLEI